MFQDDTLYKLTYLLTYLLKICNQYKLFKPFPTPIFQNIRRTLYLLKNKMAKVDAQNVPNEC